MTTVYFIRHAQSDISVHDDRIRPLTEKGMKDRALVTEFLRDKRIDVVLSSPYRRAIDTVADFAEKHGSEIETIENFRERKSDNEWIQEADFLPYIKSQWEDFSYSLNAGECLSEVQQRNISALNDVIIRHKDKNIVIGTHGTALSTIINYYDNKYGFEDFKAMVNIMPWVVMMKFDGEHLTGMWKINIFEPNKQV